MTEKSKKIHTELKGLVSERFDQIKSSLGIQNDAEVMRFLIQYYYRRKFDKDKVKFVKGLDPKEDKELIDKIINQYQDAIKRLGED